MMPADDDRVWERLQRAHQDAEPDDPLWTALSMGTLPPDEAEALRAQDPRKYELFRPFTEEESEHILVGVRARLVEQAGRRRLTREVMGIAAAALVLAGAGAWLLLAHRPVGVDVAALLLVGPFTVLAFVIYSTRRAWRPRGSTSRALLELELERRNDTIRRLTFARVVAAVILASGLLRLWFATSGGMASAGNGVFRIVFMGLAFWAAERRCTQAKHERVELASRLAACSPEVSDEALAAPQSPPNPRRGS